MNANTIDEVIETLEQIIQISKKEESTMGYFAALYQKVTIQVKEKLHTNYFDDDERMEKLDVVFANRYLLAYANFKKGNSITKSWEVAFHSSKNKELIVLQHLLLGMNAHINLDLGIAAAEVTDQSTINSLQSDFNKINDILASLIDEVQNDLSKIWPTFTIILRSLKRVDNFLINFSMNMARDGAWKFANKLIVQEDKTRRANMIAASDEKISELAKKIINPGFIERIIFKIIRIGERGKPSNKITALEK